MLHIIIKIYIIKDDHQTPLQCYSMTRVCVSHHKVNSMCLGEAVSSKQLIFIIMNDFSLQEIIRKLCIAFEYITMPVICTVKSPVRTTGFLCVKLHRELIPSHYLMVLLFKCLLHSETHFEKPRCAFDSSDPCFQRGFVIV